MWLLSLLLSGACALHMVPTVQRSQLARPRTASLRAADMPDEAGRQAAVAAAKAVETSEEETSEEIADGPRIKPGDFVLWYRQEKSIEQYKKDNPVDPFKATFDRLKGGLPTVAVITVGYYSIPTFKALFEAAQSGDFAANLGGALSKVN